MFKCFICDNINNDKIYNAKEMMFGFRDEFKYFECAKCGTLQLCSKPDNMAKYYPENYYSFQFKRRKSSLKRKLLENYFVNREIFTDLPKISFIEKYLKKYQVNDMSISFLSGLINKQDTILDFGCGIGGGAYFLKNVGFDIYGYDPYVKNIKYDNGTVIYNDLSQLKNKKFSKILFSHSLEHISNPVEILNYVHENLITNDGILIVALPIVSWAWKHYNTNWVQLDAPRHIFLPTEHAMELLVERTGFTIISKMYNSNEFQFWGSEQYAHDIPLDCGISYKNSPCKSMFTIQLINEYKEKAKYLNSINQGDQALFVMKLK